MRAAALSDGGVEPSSAMAMVIRLEQSGGANESQSVGWLVTSGGRVSGVESAAARTP
jgi:hypothetical protein